MRTPGSDGVLGSRVAVARAPDVRYALYRTLRRSYERVRALRVSAGAPPGIAPHHRAGAARVRQPPRASAPGSRHLCSRQRRGKVNGRSARRSTTYSPVEQRYALQTKLAVDRTDADPMQISRQPASADGRQRPSAARSRKPSWRASPSAGRDGPLAGRPGPGGDDPPDRVDRPRYRRAVSPADSRLTSWSTRSSARDYTPLGWRPTEGRQIARRRHSTVTSTRRGSAAVRELRVEAQLAPSAWRRWRRERRPRWCRRIWRADPLRDRSPVVAKRPADRVRRHVLVRRAAQPMPVNIWIIDTASTVPYRFTISPRRDIDPR